MAAQEQGEGAVNKRYDRQIRIWGAEGQARLEGARIALLNCSATGAETLKNLVLGGIASFTIVDGAKVSALDLGSNFLVEQGRLGQSRAAAVTALLQELNDSVAGSFIEAAPEMLLDEQPELLAGFDLVIATQMPEQQLLELDGLCRSRGTKLLAVRSYGLVGYMRASLPEHVVIESKPDSQVEDLRITCPWPALLEWAHSFDLQAVDMHTHQHVPYVVLLLQALQAWRASLGPDTPPSRLPANASERSAFRAALNSLRRSAGEEGLFVEEDNFDEALKAAFHAWAPPSIPAEVRALLEDPAADSLGASTPTFWLLVAALKKFVANEGCGRLPLNGTIPDMHTTTDLYLQLQRLYRERADADVAAVEAHVANLASEAGSPGRIVPAADVKHFCRNARNICVVRYRTLAEEYGAPPDGTPSGASLASMNSGSVSGSNARGGVGASSRRGGQLAAAMAEEGSSANANLYVLLRACDRFHQAHGRYPGTIDGAVEEDAPLLRAAGQAVLADLGVSAGVALQDDLVGEMCRLGAAELHVVASVMGGMAAQEAIKLITQQFVPFSGSLVYNAMASTTSIFNL